MTVEEQWPLGKDRPKKQKKMVSFSHANIIQRKFHTIFVSQIFLSERTQVFWLNKKNLLPWLPGTCSVSRSAINTSIIALESMGVNVLVCFQVGCHKNSDENQRMRTF